VGLPETKNQQRRTFDETLLDPYMNK